jgi:hypothetical protein
VAAAHAVVEDRLVNGETIMNPKTGELIRKPVNMRDAHRVAVDLQAQREAVEKATLPIDERKEADTNKLEMLAEKFAEFATKKIEQKLDTKRTVEMADVVEDVEPYETKMAQHDPVPNTLLLGDTGTATGMGQEEQGGDSASS